MSTALAANARDVATWLTECRREFDTEDIVAVLQQFRAKRLMIEEHGGI